GGPARRQRSSPPALAVVAGYSLLVYAIGLFALAGWPLNEHRANAQLLTVTSELAHELSSHIAPGRCFTYAPGPGWPASLEVLMTTSDGASPLSTQTDVAPAWRTSQYVRAATTRPAAVA